MKKYLLVVFQIKEEEYYHLIHVLYQKMLKYLKSKSFKVIEDINDPDGYLHVKYGDIEFGITTPLYIVEPIACGVYLEEKHGKHLDDEKIIKLVMPMIEFCIELIPFGSEKMWFSNFKDMLKKVEEIEMHSRTCPHQK